MATKGDSFPSYVTYGLLHKSNDYIDWIRVERDCVVPNETDSSPNVDAESTEPIDVTSSESEGERTEATALDVRAFEVFRSLQQKEGTDDGEQNKIKDPILKNNDENESDDDLIGIGDENHISPGLFGKGTKLQMELERGMNKFSSNIVAKIMSAETSSFGVFDANWNPLRFSPRHSNSDVAILLYAAAKEQTRPDEESVTEASVWKRRTSIEKPGALSVDAASDTVSATACAKDGFSCSLQDIETEIERGTLPVVPVRRSSQQQFLVKQSVNMFFRKESVQFFACFPLRNSPRTIYRFDMDGSDGTNGDQSRASAKWKGKLARISSVSLASLKKQSIAATGESNELSVGGDNPPAPKLSLNERLSKMKVSSATKTDDIRRSLRSSLSNTKEKFENSSFRSTVSNTKKKFSEKFKKMPSLSSPNAEATEEDIVDYLEEEDIVIFDSSDIVDAEDQKMGDDSTNNDSIVAAANGANNDAAATVGTEHETVSEQSESQNAQGPAGYVALSIDDVPGRFNFADKSLSLLPKVLDLFDKYDAKATFMVISSFLSPFHEPDMIRLLQEGHELANHGIRDEPMDKKLVTSIDVFLEALDECNDKIKDLQQKANASNHDEFAFTSTDNSHAAIPIGVKWFRAPQSRYTKVMEEGLAKRDMYNVMCDAYAACPIIEDGAWIAASLSKQIKNGSIALLHMPEALGFRGYCLTALELLLEDLVVRRNFKVVTVSELQRISEQQKASATTTGSSAE